MMSKQKGFHVLGVAVVMLVVLAVGFAGFMVFSRENSERAGNNNQAEEAENQAAIAALPDISELKANPSDSFLVDFDVIDGGHPYLGADSPEPHSGAHAHFARTFETWPKGGNQPENYPPIYAVADGVVNKVEYNFPLADHERYGVSLAIARSGGEAWTFDYSIEPFVREPSPGFYKQFITVRQGQTVKKGDIIAYMYLPEFSTGSHIHFQLTRGDNFYAPAVFTPDVVSSFQSRWGDFGVQNGVQIPSCMGWKLAAEENPFAREPAECL